MIPTQTTPAYQDPEMVAGVHHQSWLAHVMDTVGNILGGDTTLHVTKKADGSVEVTHDPSTSGEKWGRVAAAALGGAARGLAVGQGPGGPARAAAAGTEYGLQQPQQRLNEANQEATVEQERMTRNANNARLHQLAYQATLTSQDLKTNIDKQSADLLNGYRDEMAGSPNAKDFGVIKSFDDLKKTADQNPDFFKSHTDYSLKAVLVPSKDGGVEIHALATDPGDDAAVAKDDAQLHVINVDPTTGKPTLTTTKAARGTKNGQLRLANQAVDIQFANLANNFEKTNKAAVEKVPDTSGKAFGMAAQTNDPSEKENFTKLGTKLLANEMSKAAAGRSVMTNQLAGPANDDALNLAADNYRKTGVLPAGFSRSPQTTAAIMQRAAEQDKQAGGEGITANKANLDAYRKSLEKLQTNFNQVQAFENTALRNMDRLQQTLKDIPDLGSRFANIPARQISAKMIGTEAMARFNTDLQTVQTEAAKVLNSSTGSGTVTDSARHELQDIIDGKAPISAIIASMNELRVDMNNRTQSYQAQIGDVQQRIRGVGGTTTQATPTGAPPPAANQKFADTLPNVEVRTDGKGNYKQLQNGQWVDVAPPPIR
jgi:hypothetical protein